MRQNLSLARVVSLGPLRTDLREQALNYVDQNIIVLFEAFQSFAFAQLLLAFISQDHVESVGPNIVL